MQGRLEHMAMAAAIASTMALGGCGGVDGLELNGKLFDWMGISPSAQDSRTREPKLADRAPLVVPPDVNRLPEPGSGLTADGSVASINDPELTKAAAARERERMHMAYCRGEIQWKERAFDPQKATNRSPYGPCPGIFTGATGSINKN